MHALQTQVKINVHVHAELMGAIGVGSAIKRKLVPAVNAHCLRSSADEDHTVAKKMKLAVGAGPPRPMYMSQRLFTQNFESSNKKYFVYIDSQRRNAGASSRDAWPAFGGGGRPCDRCDDRQR